MTIVFQLSQLIKNLNMLYWLPSSSVQPLIAHSYSCIIHFLTHIECRCFTEHLNMVVGFIMISHKCLILLALGLSTLLYAVHLLETLKYGIMIYRDITIDYNHVSVICSSSQFMFHVTYNTGVAFINTANNFNIIAILQV